MHATGDSDPPADLPDAIIPLLRCPLCTPPRFLHAPVTLHCGHTVCAEHLPTPVSPRATPSPSTSSAAVDWSSDPTWTWTTTCPIPTCTRPSPQDAPTFIHPDARVRFQRAPAGAFPAPDGDAQERRRNSPSERDRAPVDVTVKKIIEMVARVATDVPTDRITPSLLLDDHEERTDSESEDDLGEDDQDDEDPGVDLASIEDDAPVAGSSRLPSLDDSGHQLRHRRTHRRSSPPPHSRRPRKRRCLQPRGAGGVGSTADPQRLSHSHPNDGSRGSDAAANANAELLRELKTELVCEICFALMWQPVTTPCQHVSLILIFSIHVLVSFSSPVYLILDLAHPISILYPSSLFHYHRTPYHSLSLSSQTYTHPSLASSSPLFSYLPPLFHLLPLSPLLAPIAIPSPLPLSIACPSPFRSRSPSLPRGLPVRSAAPNRASSVGGPRRHDLDTFWIYTTCPAASNRSPRGGASGKRRDCGGLAVFGYISS